MLILARRLDEKIIIRCPGGDLITIMIVEHSHRRVRLGIDAPLDYAVDREEVDISKQSDGAVKASSPTRTRDVIKRMKERDRRESRRRS